MLFQGVQAKKDLEHSILMRSSFHLGRQPQIRHVWKLTYYWQLVIGHQRWLLSILHTTKYETWKIRNWFNIAYLIKQSWLHYWLSFKKNVAKEENRGWKIIQNDSARKYGPRDISQSWNFVNQKCVRFSLGQIIVFLTNTTLIIVWIQENNLYSVKNEMVNVKWLG